MLIVKLITIAKFCSSAAVLFCSTLNSQNCVANEVHNIFNSEKKSSRVNNHCLSIVWRLRDAAVSLLFELKKLSAIEKHNDMQIPRIF